MAFRFNPESFGIGLAAGWITALLVYRYRRPLGVIRRVLSQQAASAQMSATRSADSRYIHDLIARCETTHLAGHLVHLSRIVVEPRFITGPELAAPPEDDVKHDVFYVVPRFPDHPYLLAPFNLETLSIDELSRGDRSIALLGLPGSGRTTALLTIALWSLGQVRFEQPKDKVQEQLDQEEAALPKEERTRRAKERLMLEQRAKERLSEEGESASEDGAGRGLGPLFQRLMPIYVHLGNMHLAAGAFGKTVDPAEPLVRTVQSQVKRVTAKTLPRNMYNRLNQGQALVMLDGLDDLPESERKDKLVWLEAFLGEYRRNFIIVTGPAQGYGGLTRLGLTPVYLRPWSDLDAQHAADSWAQVWPGIASGKRRRSAAPPDENRVMRAKTDTRALSPFHLTLKIWDTYAAQSDEESGYEQWLEGFLKRLVPSKLNTDETRVRLSLAAALQLNEGFITPSRLETLVVDHLLNAAGASPIPQPAGPGSQASTEEPADLDAVFAAKGVEDENVETLFDPGTQKPTETPPPAPDQPASAPPARKEAPKLGGEISKLLQSLVSAGMLVAYPRGRYQFRHPHVAAYLASLTLESATEEQLAEKAFDPAWEDAVGYAGLKRPLDAAVNARLSAPSDLIYDNLMAVSRWMPYAGATAEWRTQALRQLGNVLVAPSQYTLVRERAAAALITTRDKGALKIFRVAARNSNRDVRRLACLGMGALGDPDVIPDLAERMGDEVIDVQLAAGMALGAIGTPEAVEAMVDGLTSGTERLRQAIAEAFAAIPEDGYPLLYDAIKQEEMMLRRAAVFGLRRIRTTWSQMAIYRAFLEDPQWYVRSAAQQAFHEMQHGATEGPKGYPPPEAVPWLVNWLNELGEQAPKDQNPEDLLATALQDEDPLIRSLSAATLGQLGIASRASALYSALYDREETVRDTAHRSLGELQMQIGKALPTPV